MKYKAGDKVRIKDLGWYNENKDEVGNIRYERDGSAYPVFFSKYMSNFCGEILTIKSVFKHSYHMNETSSCEFWTDEMIECKVEEEVGLVDNLSSRWVNEFTLPEGYIFKDENGNIINTTKIVLEKKKKEYPKTFVEVLDFWYPDRQLEDDYQRSYKKDLIKKFQDLLYARDAYWKIAGEEMGLGKLWEPDWLDDDTKKYVITSSKIFETFGGLGYINYILTFPTKEMRDAFFENFKELIEQCKELL